LENFYFKIINNTLYTTVVTAIGLTSKITIKIVLNCVKHMFVDKRLGNIINLIAGYIGENNEFDDDRDIDRYPVIYSSDLAGIAEI